MKLFEKLSRNKEIRLMVKKDIDVLKEHIESLERKIDSIAQTQYYYNQRCSKCGMITNVNGYYCWHLDCPSKFQVSYTVGDLK